VAEECRGIRHLLQPEQKKINTILKNGFAFGGINAALVCRKI
jgi:3-oxoacyl-(acyl-carrier-protein) synthase